MRESLLGKMACLCGSGELALHATGRRDDEVREGAVSCAACGGEWPVAEGAVLVLNDPPFDREAALRSEAAVEGSGGLCDEWLLSLPRPGSGWETSFEPKGGRKAANFFDMLDRVAPRAGERVLELAAGACWSSARFAAQGCEVVACDIDMRKYYGLRSADVYIAARGHYFERVRCGFGRLPFRDGAFDLVFVQSGLQYADDLGLTFAEIARVLAPGGRLALVYTGVRGRLRPNRKAPGSTLRAYARAWRRAGFEARLYFPEALVPRLPLLLGLARRWGAWPASAMFGLPLNAVLTRR